jgi:hypothetical protein
MIVWSQLKIFEDNLGHCQFWATLVQKENEKIEDLRQLAIHLFRIDEIVYIGAQSIHPTAQIICSQVHVDYSSL